jgi:histidyl-tRNA synthetase
MTPTLARMVAAKANAMRKPIRWFSIPQLFRYERQQKGRLREHFQLNVDIIGEGSVAADAELLAVAIDVMRGVGLSSDDVRARVSDRRLLTAALSSLGVQKSELPAVFAAIDKTGREPRDVTLGKVEKAVAKAGARDGIARLLDHSKDLNALARDFLKSPDVVEEVARMNEYLSFLNALGVGDWIEFDLSIVRGLAYYTGKVFELFDAKGEFRAICGGGRYDALLSTIGGVDLPALGFGMGDVVLTEILKSRDLLPAAELATEYWVASDDESMLPEVMTVAGRLRAKARSVEYALKSQTLARQLKTASSAGVRNVVLLRRPDYENGKVTVKTLADGSERSIALDAFLDSL